MAQVAMGHHLMSMQCGLRALGHLSLVFGLLASGALSLAVATDFWLFTVELLVASAVSPPQSLPITTRPLSTAPSIINTTDENGDDNDNDNELDDVADAAGSINQEPIEGENLYRVVAKVHSGLWRTCLYWDEAGESDRFNAKRFPFSLFFFLSALRCLLVKTSVFQ